MEIIFRNILTLFVIMTVHNLQAQFNTLIRNADNTDKIVEKLPVVSDDTHNVNEKKNLIKPSKKELLQIMQRELDSLKKELNLNQDHTNNIQIYNVKRLEDSIIKILKKAVSKFDSSKSLELNKVNFSATKIKTNFKSQFYFPLRGRLQVSSNFAIRHHPVFNAKKMHNGTDLKANYENVITILNGVVLQSGWDSKGGGNYMKIKHANSYVTSYLHLSEMYYKVGDLVKAGYTIAKSGNSGNSTGPHLHFSVEKNGKYIDPMSFLHDLFKAQNLLATYNEK